MCITSTARRRSLNVQILPAHLLTAKASASTNHGATRSTSGGSHGSKHRYYPQQNHLQAIAAAAKQQQHQQQQYYQQISLPPLSPPHHDPSHSHVVQHHYHDHSADPTVDPSKIKHKAKGGVITPFPVKLHEMLDKIEADGLGNVVSWQPHGRCFVVHKPKEFVNHVMPKYFKQTKMASFQRQLNLYGFNRLTSGLDKGGYYHELFLRGKVSLAYDIQRMRVKGTGVRLPTNPDNEPNFYALPPVQVPAMAASEKVAAMPMKSIEVKKSPAMPPLPPLAPPKRMEMDFSMAKQPAAKKAPEAASTVRRSSVKKEENDIIFFEGCPFHYLDPSALAPVNSQFEAPLSPESFDKPLALPQKPSMAQQQPSALRPKLSHSTSVVSDSEHEDDCTENFVPSFSAANMDWEGPLSCPSIQAHMRRTSFQSFTQSASSALAAAAAAGGVPTKRHLDDDIETFFEQFDMPVDRYHEQIEHMCEDDDTAFGYLLEQAISE